MKIKIRADARNYYIARCNCDRQPTNWDWADKMGMVAGMTLDVETNYLFRDQYNTTPIQAVSDSGLRIMDYLVEEVIDDARQGMARCNWCGTSTKADAPCSKCGKTEYLEPFRVRCKGVA